MTEIKNYKRNFKIINKIQKTLMSLGYYDENIEINLSTNEKNLGTRL